MARRGRPPKARKWRKCERLDLRVNADEKRAFRFAADQANQELSVWIRIQLHKAAGQAAAGDANPTKDTHEVAEKENVTP